MEFNDADDVYLAAIAMLDQMDACATEIEVSAANIEALSDQIDARLDYLDMLCEHQSQDVYIDRYSI
jgi:hypothetical protein